MSDSLDYIILNGKIIPESKATIPAVTSGLFYGVGAFESFLSEKGRIFKFHEHIERLNAGLQYLGIPKNKSIDADSVLGHIRNLLEKNNLLKTDSKIRIQVSFGENKGYSAVDDPQLISIISSTRSNNSNTAQRLILSETSVIPSSARPAQFKLSNMLHYRQAYREAVQNGADDSIMLTKDGFIAETSIANIFWMTENMIFTPSQECNILPGIMRNSIITLLQEQMNYEVDEGNYSMDELMAANTVWLTNSVINFLPVSKIEDVSFNTERNFFSDLNEHLSAYKEENMTNV